MSAIIAGILGIFARELVKYLGDLIQKFIKKNQETAESDKKIDDVAKQTSDNMENTHDPNKMDQADSDLLSGQ